MSNSLDVLGVIGTWIAAVLAFVALVGIAAPWLLLKATFSDRNRTLNAIRDVDQDFITKGIGFSREIRFFRGCKVPDLRVAAVRGEEGSTIQRTHQRWLLKPIKGTRCHTSWSRMCRLLQAYTTSTDLQTPEYPGFDTSGKLVIKLNRAWLPMSRYWILAIGLLGRYGTRQDEGKFNVVSLRGDLREERPSATVDSEGSLDYLDESASESESTDGSGDGILPSHHSSSDASSASSINATPLSKKPATQIFGKTGRFKRLRKSGESHDITSPLRFYRHNRAESGVYPKTDASLVTLYWLAEGFISIPGCSDVFCFENPYLEPSISETESSTTTISAATAFCFKPARAVPHSIRQAVIAFGMEDSRLYSLQRVYPADNGQEEYMELGNAPNSSCRVDRAGAYRLIHGFLSLDLNGWGNLTWKSNTSLWSDLFFRPTSLLDDLLPITWMSPEFQRATRAAWPDLDLEPSTQFNADFFPQLFRRWRHWKVFNQYKTRDLALLNCVLGKCVRLPHRARIMLSTLIVTDSSLRTWITTEVAETAILSALVRTVEGILLAENPGTPAFDPETGETFRLQLMQTGSKAILTSVCGRKYKLEGFQGLGFVEDLDIQFSVEELSFVATWTAVRCALWSSSLDSKPLLGFVRQPRPTVHVA